MNPTPIGDLKASIGMEVISISWIQFAQMHIDTSQVTSPSSVPTHQAYMSGRNIAASLEKRIDLRGYVREGNTSKVPGFRLRDFHIDIKQRRAICPAGKMQVRWAKAKPGVKNLIAYHVRFGPQCQSCPNFGPGLCTDKPNGRCLCVSRYHDLIQARRRQINTAEFKTEMHIREGVEATFSEMVRAHGLRRSRYRGETKNQLQALLAATSTNLKQLARARSFFSHTVFPLLSFCPKMPGFA